MDADDEKIGDEDSQFMKLAKKLTAKTLQRKGRFDTRPHKKNHMTLKTPRHVSFLSNNNHSYRLNSFQILSRDKQSNL